jgi:hypothetical protein
VCVCALIHPYIHTYMHSCIHIHIHIHIHIQVHVITSFPGEHGTRLYICIHTYVYTYVYICIRTYVFTYELLLQLLRPFFREKFDMMHTRINQLRTSIDCLERAVQTKHTRAVRTKYTRINQASDIHRLPRACGIFVRVCLVYVYVFRLCVCVSFYRLPRACGIFVCMCLVCIHKYIHVYRYIHIYIHACICTHTRTHTLNLHPVRQGAAN